MTQTNFLYIDNDNLLEVDGLKNVVDNTYVNDAVVTAILKDAAGVEVTGQNWPLTLSWVAGSNGKYQGILDDALDLTERALYTAVISALGDTLLATFNKQFVARKRT